LPALHDDIVLSPERNLPYRCVEQVEKARHRPGNFINRWHDYLPSPFRRMNTGYFSITGKYPVRFRAIYPSPKLFARSFSLTISLPNRAASRQDAGLMSFPQAAGSGYSEWHEGCD